MFNYNVKLKETGLESSTLVEFDLLRHDEDALSASLAFLLSEDRYFYFDFLKEIIGLDRRNSKSHFKEVEVEIQKKRDEGITDIELLKKDDYHVIIECKIGSSGVGYQSTQYLESFEDVENRYIGFLTQEFQTFSLPGKDVNDVYITWLDVLNLIDENKQNYDGELFERFNRFVERGFNMTEFAKEILVQDVSIPKEVERFEEYYTYRRKESSGKPLYFAPYYTQDADPETGISRIARVLGALTLEPEERQTVDDRLELFAQELEEAESPEELISRWKKALELGDPDETKTYYFLDKPVELPGVATKNKGEESSGWIGYMIPPNRTVSFQKLMKNLEIEG